MSSSRFLFLALAILACTYFVVADDSSAIEVIDNPAWGSQELSVGNFNTKVDEGTWLIKL